MKELNNLQGIIIPGGFGNNGIENMISMIKDIRTMNIPVFGICLGMQLMIIEYLRGEFFKKATSEEFDMEGTNVITKLNTKGDLGGSMRLGLKEITLCPNSNVK